MTSTSQTKVPMSTAGQTGRVVTMVSPSTAGGTSQKLQGNGVAVNSSTVPTAVVSAAHIQTSPQAKVLMHVTGQMTVNQARNAVRTGKNQSINKIQLLMFGRQTVGSVWVSQDMHKYLLGFLTVFFVIFRVECFLK